ncbi:hypothetical protein WMY93_009447 [Mugilogobius chulae]|uniref:Teneurin N-terminal domain-containing protein n=1 Tax=Mugilogobius chulae TaxID=88201 RepID=A0AAW0PKM6_9GOBI
MDLKDRRHRSLTRGRCSKDSQYNTASLDTDECRVPTQKSYSSSETLKAFDHEQRLHYGGCMTDLVHHEADEYSRQGGNFTLAELGVCEPTPHLTPPLSPTGGYALSAGSDADSDPEGPLSPDRAIQLWAGRGGVKSRRSSGVSSRENSALTLTDSENENKSDDETADNCSVVNYQLISVAPISAADEAPTVSGPGTPASAPSASYQDLVE